MKLNMYFSWEKSRNEEFLNLLEYNPNAKVVDLDCGDGNFTLEIKNRIDRKEIYGVDIYKPHIEKAKEKGIKVVEHNLNEFPYPFKDNSFDVVVSNQVIEHLFYPVKFLKGIYRILKPGGHAIILIENLASWDNIGALVFGWTPFSMEFDSGLYKIGNPLSPHDKKLIDANLQPHVRILTYKGLIELAKFVGLIVYAIVGSGHILGKLGEKLDKRHCRFITIKVGK